MSHWLRKTFVVRIFFCAIWTLGCAVIHTVVCPLFHIWLNFKSYETIQGSNNFKQEIKRRSTILGKIWNLFHFFGLQHVFYELYNIKSDFSIVKCTFLFDKNFWIFFVFYRLIDLLNYHKSDLPLVVDVALCRTTGMAPRKPEPFLNCLGS